MAGLVMLLPPILTPQILRGNPKGNLSAATSDGLERAARPGRARATVVTTGTTGIVALSPRTQITGADAGKDVLAWKPCAQFLVKRAPHRFFSGGWTGIRRRSHNPAMISACDKPGGSQYALLFDE